MERSSKQIKVGAIISYFALAVNIVATLLYIPWMVSVIGKSNYAMYTLVYSFINIFVMDFGLSSSVSKFIAQYRAEGNREKEIQFISTVAKIYVILDIVIFAILTTLYFFIGIIYKGLTPEEIQKFKQLYIIVAAYTAVSFPFMPLSGIMYAYEKLIETKVCELIQKLLAIVMVVVALLNRADVVYVVLANVISALVVVIIKFCIVKKSTALRIDFAAANMKIFKEVVSFTVWMVVQSLAQRCIFNLAPTILGIVATSTDIAVFAPANSIESYFSAIAAAINGFFLMRITNYIVSGENNSLYQLLLKVGRFQLLLLGWIYIGFVCVGEDFMCAWMGEEYVLAWPCALLIMIPDILLFSEQVANTAAIASNHVKEQAIGFVIMAVVCESLSFPLSAKFGVVGAAMAIAAAYFVLFIYNNFLYSRKMQLDMLKFIRECYGKLILPMALVAVVGYFVCSHLIVITGWKAVMIKAVIASALYLAVMALVAVPERRYIIDIIKRRKL